MKLNIKKMELIQLKYRIRYLFKSSNIQLIDEFNSYLKIVISNLLKPLKELIKKDYIYILYLTNKIYF